MKNNRQNVYTGAGVGVLLILCYDMDGEEVHL